jgi:DNA polymerase I-like protein with 3'-5' exonuclease and polymerase domains
VPKIREYNFARYARRCYEQIMRASPSVLAVDTETNGASYYAEAFCVTMTWKDAGRLRNAYFELGDIDFAEEKVTEILDHAREEWGTGLVFHNAKFDLEKLHTYGVMPQGLEGWTPERIHDTEGIFHLLYPNDTKGLKALTVRHLGLGTVQVPVASGKNKGKMQTKLREDYELGRIMRKMGLKKSDGYHLLPRKFLVPYAMKDTEYTYRLFEWGHPKLDGRLLDTYAMEQEVCFALFALETPGIRVDVPYLEETASEFGVKIMEQVTAIQRITGNNDLSPNAPAQLIPELASRGIEVEDTEADTLRKFPDDELAVAILEYRRLTKIHKDKLRPLLEEHRDGIVHPWIRQHGAKTGRTASGKVRPDG